MKKYFAFDDEPISGSDYLLRVIFGSLLIFILIGIWILAATGYKRAGAIGLNNSQRIIAAVFVPTQGIINILLKGSLEGDLSSLMLLVAVVSGLFHLGLLLINGNTNNSIQLSTFTILDNKINGIKKLEIKLKYNNYETLDFQIIGYLVDEFNGFKFKENSKISVQLYDVNNNIIHGKYLLLKTFDTTNLNPNIKNGVFKYESSMALTKDQFAKINSCNLIEE